MLSRGLICPIYTTGDRTIPGNYRGITLLNVMGKLFTSVLENRLMMWAEEIKCLSEGQFGFRPGRRTTDHLFILSTLIEKTKHEGRTLLYLFCGYTSSF